MQWVIDHLRADESLVNSSRYIRLASRYLKPPEVYAGVSNRRLLQNETYSYFVVDLDTLTWDEMQALSLEVNSANIAASLANATNGTYQIEVLAESTTIVSDVESSVSAVAAASPGFRVTSIRYDDQRIKPDSIGDDQHFWVIDAEYYAPPEMHYALFVTRRHAGHHDTAHECMQNMDVCCLHRMNSDHYMGNFSTFIRDYITPYCTAAGGFPNATALSMPSSDMFTELHESHYIAPMLFVGGNNSVTQHATYLNEPGKLTIRLSHRDIAYDLAESTELVNGTSYTFAVGMIFFHELSVPHILAAIGQTRLRVIGMDTGVLAAMTTQAYSFLDFLDVTLFDIAYKETPQSPLQHIQFLRVVFMLPADTYDPKDGVLPLTSVRIGKANSSIYIGENDWINSCYSYIPENERDGSGLWDFDNGTRAVITAASEQTCVYRSISFCAVSVQYGSSNLREQRLYSIDVPLGVDFANDIELETGELNVFLRFLVTVRDADSQWLTEVSTRTPLQLNRVLPLCHSIISSNILDTDFVRVDLSIGTQFLPVSSNTHSNVVFHDITRTWDSDGTFALDVGKVYQAHSTMDSMLSVVLRGDYGFFTAHEHTSYEVFLDSLVLIHIRNELKYALLSSMLQNRSAYVLSTSDLGHSTIVLQHAFEQACHDSLHSVGVDCVIQHGIHNRVVSSSIGHIVSADAFSDVHWFLSTFGDNSFMRDTVRVFQKQTFDNYAPNFRYRKVYWLLPTYDWPQQSSIGFVDHTIILLSYGVQR